VGDQAGDLELQIPKVRTGSFFPSLRVYTAEAEDYFVVRDDEPVPIAPRRTDRADALVPGIQARFAGGEEFETVTRVTGSPGRSSASGIRLVRVFTDVAPSFRAIRADTRVEVRSNS
jgi:hypothetical protein